MTENMVNTFTELNQALQWLNGIRLDQSGFIFTIQNKKTNTIQFTNHADAINKIKPLIDNGQDIFISVANFKPGTNNRKAENVDFIGSFFIDIDCGENKAYKDQREALSSLKPIFKNKSFPKPSMVINSGGGIHAYWCLKTPLARDEWLTLAKELKEFWIKKGINIDPVVTGDCARVMRVPNSFNYKLANNPRVVKIIKPISGTELIKYSLEEIKQILLSTNHLDEKSITKNKTNLHNLLDKSCLFTNNESSAMLIKNHCKQVEHILNNGGVDRSEPEWFADLGLLKHTLEAPIVLHTISEKHPEYNYHETDRKASQWTSGPTKCEHYFKKLASKLCDNCSYKGKITSPIQLGYQMPRGLKNVQNQVSLNLTTSPPPAYLSAPKEILEISFDFAWDKNEMNLYNIKTGRYIQKDRFYTNYANKFINQGTSQKPKLMPLGNAWIQHPLRREANGVRMVPNQPLDLPDGAINSWLGFSVQPKIGNIKPFIKLLKHLIPFPNDRKYVLWWIANIVQNPAEKIFTSIVMWSRIQGTGKNLLWETVGNLFNERHYTLVSQEVFDDAFTDWKANRVFVICDEVSSTEKRATSDRIKGWITSSNNSINTKNEPKFSQPNLIKFVFLSNHPDAVFLDDTDRRFFIIEVLQGRLSELDAAEFVSWRDNGGSEALLYFLHKLNTSKFNPKAPAPMSHAKQEMIDDNKSDFEQWLDHTLINLNLTIGREICSADEISRCYQTERCTRISAKTINITLQKRGIKRLHKQAKLKDGKRVRIYALKNYKDYILKSDKELGEIIDAKPIWCI